MVIGLTGQSGAGKTMVSEIFKKEGFFSINCDEVARAVTVPESECTKELKAAFPQLFDGYLLNRKKAAELLFSSREELDRFNALIFPHIRKEIDERIFSVKSAGVRYILLDAPTLFESGADKLCDLVVSCVASETVRLERIMSRDGISEELAKKRFASQKSEEFFREKSDYIIENNGGIELAAKQALEVARRIKDTERDSG